MFYSNCVKIKVINLKKFSEFEVDIVEDLVWAQYHTFPLDETCFPFDFNVFILEHKLYKFVFFFRNIYSF